MWIEKSALKRSERNPDCVDGFDSKNQLVSGQTETDRRAPACAVAGAIWLRRGDGAGSGSIDSDNRTERGAVAMLPDDYPHSNNP